MKDEEVKPETEIYLYGPKDNKDLRKLYPELHEVAEFSRLSEKELLFVWWYCNKTSPLVKDKLSDVARALVAYDKAFGAKGLDKELETNYKSLNFPSKIKIANDKMRSFNPTVRARAKNIIDNILDNFESMMVVNMNDFKTTDKDGNTEINWTGRNNYVSSATAISKVLPQLIEQSEQGFGVSEVKTGEDAGLNAIQRYHSSNKE